MDEKVIRDSVLGYIYIPSPLLSNIVDTPEFQRLRRIEQTSMRCLFPSARHDRFIHSLGVYHLAKFVTATISHDKEKQNYYELLANFEVAALLHDIGHSPFSHTLESNFDKKKLLGKLSEYSEITSWTQNALDDIKFADAAEHEIMSVIVILEKFKTRIESFFNEMDYDFSPNFEFIARSILGAQYRLDGGKDYVTENGLIRLLNSKAIDIDKLDFITRDSQMAGYDNTTIDIQRLLRSLNIRELGGAGYIAFTKNAVSVLENVVRARNGLYSWVYGHPRVVYETKLIQNAVRAILNDPKKGPDTQRLQELFTVEGIISKLFCDDDVWCIFKNRIDDISQCRELFNRGIQMTPIWKSPTEFAALFSNPEVQKIGSFNKTRFIATLAGDNDKEKNAALDYIAKYIPDLREEDFVTIKPVLKMANLDAGNIYVSIGEDVYPYSTLNPTVSVDSFPIPYLYCSRENKKKIIGAKSDVRPFCDYLKSFEGFALRDDVP